MQSYGRLVFALLRIIALARTGRKDRVPVTLVVDEFQNFVSEDFETALTQLRKFGFSLILANQFAGQHLC